MGVLTVRALLFGVYIRAPDVWKLPFAGSMLGSGKRNNAKYLCISGAKSIEMLSG